MLWEQLQELARSPDNAQRPADYHNKLKQAERSAAALRESLANGAAPDVSDEIWSRVTADCTACHRAYRN